jgi:hypothetical protein
LAGNVSSNTLTSFVSDFKPDGYSDAINGDIVIKNVASTNSGADPEEIDDAYYNYKRTIGTFNTLVTLLDYENAMYTSIDGVGAPYISNGVASDRTCDINYTTKVVELTSEGNAQKLYIDKVDSVPKMTAFDIGLYILEPMTEVYSRDNKAIDTYFNRSFGAITSSGNLAVQ